ncbi:MAG: hypothetical protein HY059_11110 [Proteobacteria bacterium]|nr:hypothetical protein [Pseudomonadota bacterium]
MLAWLVHAAPALAQNDASPLDDPTGFWLVAETGPPVNQGIASIPIIGLAVRAQIGNPRAVWEIRREGDVYSIDIPSRSLSFRGLSFADRKFHAEAVDTGTPSGRIVLEVSIADGRLAGRLAYPAYAFELDGRPPESVEALRQAFVMARGRLAEIDGPYVVPEIEKLRQENVVLIERIRRVEAELRQRGGAVRPPAAEPTLSARISMRGVVADLSVARAAALRAAPDANGAIVAQLAGGSPLVRLGEAPVPGWLLVADTRGVVGYLQTVQTAAVSSPAAAAVLRAPREISISFPIWDSGRSGRRMTVADPGFVSLVGRVRGDAPLRDVRIADSQTVFNPDGSFTSVVPVPREGRKVRIEASFASGPAAILEFEIIVLK